MKLHFSFFSLKLMLVKISFYENVHLTKSFSSWNGPFIVSKLYIVEVVHVFSQVYVEFASEVTLANT